MYTIRNWEKRIQRLENSSLQTLEGDGKRLSKALNAHRRADFFRSVREWLTFTMCAAVAISFFAFCNSTGAPLSQWNNPAYVPTERTPKAWMGTSWALILGMYVYEVWLLHHSTVRKSAYGAMRVCYGLIVDLEGSKLRWTLTETRADLARSVESLAQHVEQVPKAFAKRDKTLRSQLVDEAMARADHLRGYKVWLYSPMESTRSDLARELTTCLGRMVDGEWLALPACTSPREQVSAGERFRSAIPEALPLVFSLALMYFRKDLGPFAVVATPVAGLFILQFLTRRNLVVDDVTKAASLLSFKDR